MTFIAKYFVWLNGKYLGDNGTSDEIEQFSDALFDEALSRKVKSSEFAYHACCVLSEIKEISRKKEVEALKKELVENPTVTLMLSAHEDIPEFADEHFNTNVMDCYDCRTTKDSEEDSVELCQKYAGTKYEKLMRLLGTPSKEL